MKIVPRSRKVQLGIILFFTLLAYSTIFDNQFVWDDHHFIKEWGLIKSFNHVPELLQGATPLQHKGVYRPVRSIVYMFSYSLFELNPVGYHVQALLVHIGCTLLVFYLLLHLTRNSQLTFIATLLFGVHPIHTEAITFITTSFDVVGVLFMLISLLLYLKCKGSSLYWASLVFALLAFFTYELTLVLPFLVLLCDVFMSNKNTIKEIFHFILARWLRYIPYVIGVLVYLFFRTLFVEAGARNHLLPNALFIALAMCIVFAKYIVLLFVPYKLSVSQEIVPGIYTNYANFSQFLTITHFLQHALLWCAVVVLIALLITRISDDTRLVIFSSLWFFISLLPVTNIVPLSTIMAEKYVYIASIGGCLLFAYVIVRLHSLFQDSTFSPKIITLSLLCIVVISFTLITINRNNDWDAPHTLWPKTAQSAPLNGFVHTNAGAALIIIGDFEGAELFLKRSLEINPQDYLAYNNLGSIYRKKGDLFSAHQMFLEAHRLNPSELLPLRNIGEMHCLLNQTSQGIEWAWRALEIEPSDFLTYELLAYCLERMGDYDAAYSYLLTALSYAPDNIHIKQKIAFYENLGNE